MPQQRPSPDPAAMPALQFRARVMHRGEIAFGPGKAELLTAIETQGSIAGAAKALGMSYMRAWTLVKIANNAFRMPLVVVDRGGSQGGQARLTKWGSDVLGLYHGMLKKSRASTRSEWRKLQRRLKA